MRQFLLIIALLLTALCVNSQVPTLLLSTHTLDASELPMDSVFFQYGNKNELNESLRIIFSSSEQKWKEYWKKTNAYDVNGQMISETTYIPLNNSWVEWKKTDYQYDEMEQVTTEIFFNWEKNSWVKKETMDYFYNKDNGLLDSSVSTKFDNDGTQSKYERHTLTYDNEGKLTIDLTETWDETLNTYEALARDKYNYNLEGKLLREDHDSWLGYWYASHFFYYYYTSFGEIEKRVRYVTSTNQIYDTRYYNYNKEDNTTGVNESNIGMVSVYPNPFSDKLVLDLENGVYNVSINDIAGRTVLEMDNVSGRTTFDTVPFKKGVYFYKISRTDGDVYTGKIISQ